MLNVAFEQAKSAAEINNYPPPQNVEFNYKYDDVVTQAKGIDVIENLGRLHGPSVEIGGPTHRTGWNVLIGGELPSNTIITNKYENGHSSLDLRADASNLPFGEKSVGALFTSYLPQTDWRHDTGERLNLRHAFLEEAKRCLEPDGLLIAKGFTQGDVEDAIMLGFTPVRLVQDKVYFPRQQIDTMWDCVFMSTNEDPNFEYASELLGLSAERTPALALGAMSVENVISSSGESLE